VTILDPTLNIVFIFSFDLILSLSALSSGFEMDEVNIWDSSPGRDGFIDSIDSIVTFNYSSVQLLPCHAKSDRLIIMRNRGLSRGGDEEEEVRRIRTYRSCT